MDDAVPTIVVVGSGGAGLAAALAAAEAARANDFVCRIVLIEKARQGAHGGNTRWSPSYMRMAAPDRVEPELRGRPAMRSQVAAWIGAYVRRLAAEAPATDRLAHGPRRSPSTGRSTT